MVFLYDRSGVQYSPPFNIHQHPETFIRAILAITSLEESVLGFDSSIQWLTNRMGRKTSGTVYVTQPDGEKIEFNLVNVDPESRRYTIRGRGTTCWRARRIDEWGVESEEEYAIKYSWQSDGRESEHLLLEEVIGMKGVGQMVTRGRVGKRIASWRDLGSQASIARLYDNRSLTCIVLKYHGPSIRSFSSESQLFEALRDAISGEGST